MRFILVLMNLVTLFSTARFSKKDDDLIAERVKTGEWKPVSLANALTTQIGTWGFRAAYLGIDKNMNTSILACKPCNGSLVVGAGWWKIILSRSFKISAVQLIATNNKLEANYLQEFGVAVSNGIDEMYLCSVFQAERNVEASSTISMICILPRPGKEVIVFRLTDSKTHPDKLSFAEISIFSE